MNGENSCRKFKSVQRFISILKCSKAHMVLKSVHFRFMVKEVQVLKKLNETGVSSTETVMKANKTEWSSKHSTRAEEKCHGSRSYDYRFFFRNQNKK